MTLKKTRILLILIITYTMANAGNNDSYAWLEEVEGEAALEFVYTQNKKSEEFLTNLPYYKTHYQNAHSILNSDERIAYPTIIDDYIYNFWQDSIHQRGIWRRTSKKDFLTESPHWEILLDIDSLSKAEDTPWDFKGSRTHYKNTDNFLIFLSDGGTDAASVREFNVTTKSFKPNGFTLQESKSRISYYSPNTLIISPALDSSQKTESGYPREVRLWNRGEKLSESPGIFSGNKTDVLCVGYPLRDNDSIYIFIDRRITFFSSETYVWHKNSLHLLPIPLDAKITGMHKNQLLIRLSSNWELGSSVYKQGTLLSLPFKELLANSIQPTVIFEPDEKSSISGVVVNNKHVLINKLTNVANSLYIYTLKDSTWNNTKLQTPELGSISIVTSDRNSCDFFFTYTNFLTPTSLFKANTLQPESITKTHSLPHFFNAENLSVSQHFAISKDGTAIPYFLVASKHIEYNGNNPTLLYAYGGFEISLTPSYPAITGKSWLEQGGVYVIANIRGGGEYGPQWHQAGLKQNRQTVFNDFYAVAEDLISKKITSPKHLGIMGGSNGGLLVGVAITQRPELFNTAICLVPLLDMQNFNKLLAGASWVDEYGNPDSEEDWAYIQKYSPYHNVHKNITYPNVFFLTSTKDDRVHPAHARKMAAKMLDYGHNVLYYENTEGGHAGSSTNAQRAHMFALQYAYLQYTLSKK